MSYARVPRTIELIDGITGTAAVALTTAGTEVIARAEPTGLSPTSADRWLTAICSDDPTGGALGTVVITVFGSNDGGLTWEDTGGGGTPSAQTIADATTGGTSVFSQDDTGGSNFFGRLPVDWFERYKVEFSGVTEVIPPVTYRVLIGDCEAVA